MAFAHRILPDAALLYEHWSANCTVDEVDVALRIHHESPEFEALRFIVSDERGITGFDFGPEEIRQFAARVTANKHRYTGRRWAFVVEDARSTGLALLFGQLLEGIIDFRVFSTRDAALQWLGIPDAACAEVESFLQRL